LGPLAVPGDDAVGRGIFPLVLPSDNAISGTLTSLVIPGNHTVGSISGLLGDGSGQNGAGKECDESKLHDDE
jgi:hypothetical protein